MTTLENQYRGDSVLRKYSCLLFLTCMAILNCAGQPPTKMTHLIVSMSGTGFPADSFAAKPKTMWRATNQYCRINEEPDPDQGIHGNTIINEPDVWMVNLISKSAQHIVDEGPTFDCKLPIFVLDETMVKSKVAELEFGRELEFFKKNNAKKVDGPKLSFPANYYRLEMEGAVLSLVERSDVHAPIMVGFSRGDTFLKVKYSLWDDQVPFKAELFAKPADVKIIEAK